MGCVSVTLPVGCPQLRGRVVVVKYDRKPLSNKTLFAFCEPFGTLREHLVLKNKVRPAQSWTGSRSGPL